MHTFKLLLRFNRFNKIALNAVILCVRPPAVLYAAFKLLTKLIEQLHFLHHLHSLIKNLSPIQFNVFVGIAVFHFLHVVLLSFYEWKRLHVHRRVGLFTTGRHCVIPCGVRHVNKFLRGPTCIALADVLNIQECRLFDPT